MLDLFSFEDSRYCPIFNLDKLHDLCWSRKKGQNSDCAFLWESGIPLTLSVMNDYLESLLAPFLKNSHCKYSCHSFRSGLPSFMASHPDTFSELDIQTSGRWGSTVVKRYCRTKGIATKTIMKKIHKKLKK